MPSSPLRFFAVRSQLSSQLASTVSRTFFVYSLRFSLYRFEASTLAGDDVLGSFSRLSHRQLFTLHQSLSSTRNPPLDTRQDSRHIIRRTPPILQNIQTQLARAIHIRMEHFADELDARRLVGVCLLEVHNKAEGAVLEGRVRRPDDDGVPAQR